MTTERVIEILEDHVCYERKKANEAAVEGDAPWAVAHTYAELGLERIKNEIRKEEKRCHMSVRAADGTTSGKTARTVEDVPVPPITGSRPTARLRIPIDRLPDAPEPTLPYREPEKLGIGAWIDHDYRVRMAKKKRNDRRDT